MMSTSRPAGGPATAGKANISWSIGRCMWRCYTCGMLGVGRLDGAMPFGSRQIKSPRVESPFLQTASMDRVRRLVGRDRRGDGPIDRLCRTQALAEGAVDSVSQPACQAPRRCRQHRAVRPLAMHWRGFQHLELEFGTWSRLPAHFR
jgi:hypothetical protein